VPSVPTALPVEEEPTTPLLSKDAPPAGGPPTEVVSLTEAITVHYAPVLLDKKPAKPESFTVTLSALTKS